MEQMKPENATESSKHIYQKYKINVATNESSRRAYNKHRAGELELGHAALSKLLTTIDATSYGIHDLQADGKQLMHYQGGAIHEGAIAEAEAAGVSIVVEQPEIPAETIAVRHT